MNLTKPWYRSSTIWFNVAAFMAAAGPLISAYLIGSGFGKELAGQIAGGSGLISALINLWLRVAITKTGISPLLAPPVEGSG